MSKALDSGKSFVEQVLAKLPENLRESAKAAFAAPEAAEALTLVGDGVLARGDYSKHMDAMREQQATLTEDYEKLTAWYEPRKAVLDKYPSLDAIESELTKARGTVDPPLRRTEEKPMPFASKEDFEKYLAERDQARDQGYAGVLAYTTTLTAKHLRDFNEVLDMGDLVQHATKNRKSLADAYQEKYGDKIKAKADAEEQARIDKLVAEKLAEARKQDAQHPFPLRNASPSVLDVLESKDHKPSDHTLDTAVAEYERLQSLRG